MKQDYSDIIDLPHHVSEKHPPLSSHQRAGQFAPFSALNGFGATILETGRYTESKPHLDETEKDYIKQKLDYLLSDNGYGSLIKITYFVKDEKKSGGKYENKATVSESYDNMNSTLVFENNLKININNLINIEIGEEIWKI